MTGNDFIAFLLRTPLHVVMGNTMLITVTGCKTGNKYSTPVGFFRAGDVLWVMTRRDRTWWRNLTQGADVTLLLRGKDFSAFAKAQLDEKAVEECMLDYVRRIPLAAKSLGIRMENKIPNEEDVRRTAEDRLFVRIQLVPT